MAKLVPIILAWLPEKDNLLSDGCQIGQVPTSRKRSNLWN